MPGDKRGDWWDKCALVCVCVCVCMCWCVCILVCVCAMKQCSITYGTLNSTDVTYQKTRLSHAITECCVHNGWPMLNHT